MLAIVAPLCIAWPLTRNFRWRPWIRSLVDMLVSFDEDIPKDLQIECSICLHTVRDPHMVDCCTCGYRLCKTCINPLILNKRWPLCNCMSSTIIIIFLTSSSRSSMRNGCTVQTATRHLGVSGPENWLSCTNTWLLNLGPKAINVWKDVPYRRWNVSILFAVATFSVIN